MLFFLIRAAALAQVSVVSEESLDARFDYSVKLWNSENGLTQKNVLSMFQSSDGFMWFVSDHCVTRFDGMSFKTFNAGNTRGLPAEGIRNIYEDAQHGLWLNCGRQLLQFSERQVRAYSLPGEEERISCIAGGKDQAILVGSPRGRVYRFSNGVFSLLCDLGPVFITSIRPIDGSLYIATKSGLFVLRDNTVKRLHLLQGMPVMRIQSGTDGVLYVSSLFHLYTMKGDSLSEYNLPDEIVSETADNPINDFLVDGKELWLAGKNGVFIVKGNSYSQMDVHSGLAANDIKRFLKDQEGNIWLCTSNAGINKLRRKVIRSYAETENFHGGSSGSIISGKNGSILISSYCNGIYEFNGSIFRKLESYGCNWTLLLDRLGNLWGGSYGGGVFKSINGHLQRTYGETDGLPSNQVFCLYEDRENRIWAGTSEGLCYVEGEKFVTVKAAGTNSINHITQDRKGRIWFCSKNGLGSIDQGMVRIYTTENGLPHNNVRYLYEDRSATDTYWITTYGGGLARLRKGVFSSYGKVSGLTDEFASCVLEDDQQRLWISTNNGIYSIYKKDLNAYADHKASFVPSMYYGRESGMKYTECNGAFQSPGLKRPNGELMFPTINGFVVLDPAKAKQSAYVPDVFIDRITADDSEFAPSDSVLRLPGSTRKIEIMINAPFFGDPRNLLLRYRLEGLETEWNYMRGHNLITYRNLQPADYTLVIESLGAVRNKTGQSKRISLVIPAPFYKTWTFFYGALLCGTLLLLCGVYLRVSIIRRNEAEKTEINKNYAQLELKALQSQMNPHFIFNCLNTIKYFISTNDKVSAGKYLGKFANLVRLFLINSGANYIPLKTEIELLKLYVELEQLRLDHRFELILDIDSQLETESVEIPGMLFQPFVENAIHHGLHQSSKERILHIRFRKDGDLLIGIVEDNGIGRAASLNQKSRYGSVHVSMGIKTIRERIQTINYIENIQMLLEITDKVSDTGEALGTIVTLTIPLKRPRT